ncbi:MAG: M24 family metallopeptidase [Candidatus Nanoarchaeia archaeon]
MKIKKLQKKLREKNISCIILSGLSEETALNYLLGFVAERCLLILPKKGNPFMVAPKMEIPHIRSKTNYKVVPFDEPADITLKKAVGKHKRIGINKNIITVKEFEWLKRVFKNKSFVDISSVLYELRAVKSQNEIKMLKKSAQIASKIMRETFESLALFRTEAEIKRFMMKKAAMFGCEMAFDPLVASGKNTGFIHYSECNKRIKKGFFYVDFGVDYKGYKSDITRTTYIGTPSKKEREIFNSLSRIQRETIKLAKPGVTCSELDQHVRRRLGDFSANFTHALGHGVGLEVHEEPIISSRSKTKLKEGMVITIEPGVYFPGKFGMRIEDTIVITNTGAKVLTTAPKNLI